MFSSSCIMYGVSSARRGDRGVAARSQDRVRAVESESGAGDLGAGVAQVLAGVLAQRHGLRAVAADAVRHGAEQSGGRGGGDRKGHGLRRRQAVAARDARRGCVARLPAGARGAGGGDPQPGIQPGRGPPEPAGDPTRGDHSPNRPGRDSSRFSIRPAPTSAPTGPPSRSSPRRFRISSSNGTPRAARAICTTPFSGWD